MDRDLAFTTCPLCEATCGLELTVEDGAVTKIRGDADDVFSQGFICPKGNALQYAARGPRPRSGRRCARTGDRRVRGGVAGTRRSPRSTSGWLRSSPSTAATPSRSYLGNPSAHGHEAVLYTRALLKALGSKNVYQRVDRRPDAQADRGRAHVRHGLQRARSPTSTAPTTCCCSGANPLASNGSLMTAPDFRGRLRRDPASAAASSSSSTRAARAPPRSPTSTTSSGPGTDALLLFALVHVLFAEGLVSARPARGS